MAWLGSAEDAWSEGAVAPPRPCGGPPPVAWDLDVGLGREGVGRGEDLAEGMGEAAVADAAEAGRLL